MNLSDSSHALLVERIISAPGMVSVLHAPAGFGKTALLEAVRQSLTLKGEAVGTMLAEADGMAKFPWLLIDDDELSGLDARKLRAALDQAILARTGIVIATRKINLLPIARLRAERRVLRFGPKQIGMSHRESVRLLSTAMDKGVAEWLAALANGWTVAVATLLDYAHDSDARFEEKGDFLTASGLAAYIDQEILADLPLDAVSALRFASILDGCNESELNAIRPSDDLGRQLVNLRELLPGLVEDSGGQTVLNPLFRLHLSRQFEQMPRTERVSALERAALCCAANRRIAEAAKLVAKVGTRDAVTDFIRRSEGLRLWITGGYDVVRAIVERAGSHGVDDEPRLKLLQCLVHLRSGEISKGERLYQEVAPQLVADDQERRDAAIVQVALLIFGCRAFSNDDLNNIRRALLASGDDPAWQSLILSAQAILEIQRGNLDTATAIIFEGAQQALAARSDYGSYFFDLHRITVALAQGDILRARALMAQARSVYRQKFDGDSGFQTILESLTASLEFEAGRLSSARLHLRRSAHRAAHAEAWLDIYVACYEPMARMLATDMGLAPAMKALLAEQESLMFKGLPRVAELLKAVATCLAGEAILRGEPVEQPLVSHRPDTLPASLSWHEREIFSMAASYVALCRNEADVAINTMEELIRSSEPLGLQRSVLRAKLLLVAAFERQGDAKQSDQIFEEALSLGAGTGMTRAFAEIGGGAVRRRVHERIVLLDRKKIVDPAATRLLRALARWDGEPPSGANAKFTSREIDVLNALNQGGADKQIGRRLGITDHAVRYHLNNIYRKFGVNDRVAALAQARDAGLLD